MATLDVMPLEMVLCGRPLSSDGFNDSDDASNDVCGRIERSGIDTPDPNGEMALPELPRLCPHCEWGCARATGSHSEALLSAWKMMPPEVELLTPCFFESRAHRADNFFTKP